jgi:tetratricopeptide (TPR) repeat protein
MSPNQLVLDARSLLNSGKVAEAAAALETVVGIEPGHIEALRTLALIGASTNQIEQAIGFLETAISAAPEDSTLAVALARLFQAQGRHDDARQLFERAIANDPRLGSAYLGLTDIEIALGNHQAAIDHCHAGIQIVPDFGPLHSRYGALLEATDQPELAFEALTKAADLDPLDANARNNLGKVHLGMDRTTDAANSFRIAISLSPDWVLPRLNLANLLVELGDYKNAEREFEAATDLVPAESEALSAFAEFLNDREAAPARISDLAKRALQADSNNVPAIFRLGVICLNEYDNDAALKYFERANDLAPDRVEILNNLASVYNNIKRYPEGLAAATRSTELSPDNVEALNTLGVLHMAVRNYADAVTQFERRSGTTLVNRCVITATSWQGRRRSNIRSCLTPYWPRRSTVWELTTGKLATL